jgi:hypothetical protein
MSDTLTFMIAGAVFLAYLAGAFGPSLRRRSARPVWRKTPFQRPRPALAKGTTAPDGADQLRTVMNARFDKQKLLSREEARVFLAAERVIRSEGLNWRVMAQVSLGEVLRSPDASAFAAINSKRVDILLIAADGEPLAAIEYQGSGHYLGTAAARDAVKKEALRRAGIGYIEVFPDLPHTDLERAIRRLAGRGEPVAA